MAVKRYKLFACEVFKAETEALIPRCGNMVDADILNVGLHAVGAEKMSAELQKALDTVDPSRYDAVLLLYGLCSYGTVGLHSPLPIVIPRAHDCITLFMGSRRKYRDYFDAHKGTYFVTPSIMEGDLSPEGMAEGFKALRASLEEKYEGEDLEFLLETLGDPLREYRHISLVNNGIGITTEIRKKCTALAESRGWGFEEIPGSTILIEKLLAGNWDPGDFLILPPGQSTAPSYDEDIILASFSL